MAFTTLITLQARNWNILFSGRSKYQLNSKNQQDIPLLLLTIRNITLNFQFTKPLLLLLLQYKIIEQCGKTLFNKTH